MLTREEYKETVTRIFNNMRKDKDKGIKGSCDTSMSCKSCPFNGEDIFCLSARGIDNIFNALECVEKWAKKNPLPTYEDKYIEMFGVRPVDEDGEYVCPSNAGFANIIDKLCEVTSCGCDECSTRFWKSEYVPPKQN